jgi:iron complex transport system ATP-binding protein
VEAKEVPMKFLEVSNIDCYYGTKKVLENVIFSVDKGEFFGVIGPNGSGKTTLLRCTSGVLKPRSGVVRVNGLNVHTLGEKEIAKNIAVVPQASAISFSFTALEIVMMGRNPHISRFRMENERDYKIAENAMELTHVKHLASRPIDTLSGGEQQRVIIARALAQEPNLLLLDEPTVHLDISHQLEIMELIRKLNRDNDIIVVAVFHDLNLAAQYCNRLMLLDSGRVSSIGAPHEVLTPENIRKTYHVDVLVKEHPLSSSLYVIPFSPAVQRLTSGQKGVHIICGGGSGAQLIRMLHDEGYNLTAGVLNVLDSDYEVAVSFSISTVEEAPFSQITDESYERNLKHILSSDVVVVANAFFGEGNLLNLKAAKTALDHHIPVILVESTPFSERNFAGREGEELYNSVRERAELVQRPEDVLKIVD